MKTKILIFGVTGMLGHKLYYNLPKLNKNLILIGIVRSKNDKKLLKVDNSKKILLFRNFKKEKELEKLLKLVKPNLIINALGIIKQKKMYLMMSIYFSTLFSQDFLNN